MSKSIGSVFKLNVIARLLLTAPLLCVSVANAVESSMPGPKPVGHAPVVTINPIASNNGVLASGHIMETTEATLSYAYVDKDGDPDGSAVEWLLNGSVVATGTTYTPPAFSQGQTLQARVTPLAATGDPAAGVAPELTPPVVIERVFTKPDTTIRNWSDANEFCNAKGGGYRLPTSQELIDLYVRRTGVAAGTRSNNMCDIHGWPLYGGRCGGSSDLYWTSEVGDMDMNILVGMGNGSIYGWSRFSGHQVTCVR
ncbi:hypothetical protein [Aeromonas veronii]|uniref:hypothetical protein n=1 Tax=Aeromonas veronii TaxID=654 RepID=UPI003BA3E107